jgi:general secretion pathway protein N
VKRYAPVLIALVLLAGLTLQWLGWPPPMPVVESANAPGGNPSVVSSTQPDLLARLETFDTRDNYASIVERPLFRPDRKPEPLSDEPAGTLGPEASVELSAFDLSAVLITSETVSAWVRDPTQLKLRRLRIGDDLQGWSVTDIQEDRVLLERQGRQDALVLRDYSKPAPATAPPAARKVPPRPPPRVPARPESPKP